MRLEARLALAIRAVRRIECWIESVTYSSLLRVQVVGTGTLDLSVRQAAAVNFKNTMKTSWVRGHFRPDVPGEVTGC